MELGHFLMNFMRGLSIIIINGKDLQIGTKIYLFVTHNIGLLMYHYSRSTGKSDVLT